MSSNTNLNYMLSSSINYIFHKVPSEVRSTLSFDLQYYFWSPRLSSTTIMNYYPKPNNGYKYVQQKRNNLTLLMNFVGNLLKENHLLHGLIY